MRENPLTEGKWGMDWLFAPEDWQLMSDQSFGPLANSPLTRSELGFNFNPTNFSSSSESETQKIPGFDFGTQDMASGFSLANLGGIFGGNDKSNNGMGDLYNLLLALNTGKGGANGTNLFSGIEV